MDGYVILVRCLLTVGQNTYLCIYIYKQYGKLICFYSIYIHIEFKKEFVL